MKLPFGSLRHFIFAFTSLLWTFNVAHATYAVEVSPINPTAGHNITARLSYDAANICYPDAGYLSPSTSSITLTLSFSDGCNPLDLAPYHDYPIGSLATGTYLFTVRACNQQPPPIPITCVDLASTSFSVISPQIVDSAPTTSIWSLALLMFALAALAWIRRGRLG